MIVVPALVVGPIMVRLSVVDSGRGGTPTKGCTMVGSVMRLSLAVVGLGERTVLEVLADVSALVGLTVMTASSGEMMGFVLAGSVLLRPAVWG